ncbi:MAG: hypothetical protein ACK41P_09515 [Asticcacaulis sp.]
MKPRLGLRIIIIIALRWMVILFGGEERITGEAVLNEPWNRADFKKWSSVRFTSFANDCSDNRHYCKTIWSDNSSITIVVPKVPKLGEEFVFKNVRGVVMGVGLHEDYDNQVRIVLWQVNNRNFKPISLTVKDNFGVVTVSGVDFKNGLLSGNGVTCISSSKKSIFSSVRVDNSSHERGTIK